MTGRTLVVGLATALVAGAPIACADSERLERNARRQEHYLPPAVEIESLGVEIVARPRFCGWNETCVLSAPPLIPGVLPIQVGRPIALRIHTSAGAVAVLAYDHRERLYVYARPRRADNRGSRWLFVPHHGRAPTLNLRIDYRNGRGRFQLRTRRATSTLFRSSHEDGDASTELRAFAACAAPAPSLACRSRGDELAQRDSYDVSAVIYPRIDELLEQVPSRYALVIAAAKRARQINNYHQQLGEGTFQDVPPPLVESRSKNYLTMALEEVAEGKIRIDSR